MSLAKKRTRPGPSVAARRKPAKAKAARRGAKVATRHDRFPSLISPELPTLVDTAPEGDNWLHELKFDGYRMIAFKNGPKVRFETRNHLDWTHKVSALAEAVARLPDQQLILDGEVVALDERGISDFQLLQNAFRVGGKSEVYMVFDVLFRDGVDLRDRPLEERQKHLAQLKLPAGRGSLRTSEALVGRGAEVFHAASRAGLEGIVSKRRGSAYRAGRSTDWLKTKCQNHAEFVIGGFSEPAGSRKGFGALLLGYFRGDRLIYAGRVGTGFSDRLIIELHRRLQSLERKTSPFAELPRGEAGRGIHWVRPELVAQIRFSNWTRDKLLRQPAFLGLREDKPAGKVHKEQPQKLRAATKQPGNGRAKPKSGSRATASRPRSRVGSRRPSGG